jgi:hypothetical protein
MISRAINNKKLEYEALSYVWGSPERTREVIVRAKWPRSNKVLRISKNLSTALRYLRQQDEERILWVDAICINQDDLNERSKEVKMMGSIYKNARRVVVWLGEGDEHSSLAMETLEDLGNGININDVSAAKYNLGFVAGSTAFQLEKPGSHRFHGTKMDCSWASTGKTMVY